MRQAHERPPRRGYGRRVSSAVIAAVIGLVGCGAAPGATSTATVPPSQTVPSPPSAPPTPAGRPAPAAPLAARPSASRPCGTSPRPPVYRHVVWIVMENRGYGDVVGSPSAPYLASLARACGLATRYSGVAHPSLPNYLALTSGATHGISDDDSPAAHPVAGPSIFSQARRWHSFEEAMPGTCVRDGSGDYAVKHNPAAYYVALAATCGARDVPLTRPPDLSAVFTLIVPDLCHDMHDCSTSTGDTWLAGELHAVLDAPTYRAGHTAVFVTWDENDSGGTLVPTYVVAPSVRPGTRSGTSFTHYSLLRTTEELLGLRPFLGHAATAPSMRSAFRL